MAVALLSLLVFGIDLLTPKGVAVGALYVIPVLLTLPGRARWPTTAAAGWCTSLLLLDVVLGAPGAALSVTLANRGFSLLALWSVVTIVHLHRVQEQRAASEREKSLRLFQMALEAAPDGMLVTNPSGLIQMANATASRMFGYAAGELLGQPISRLIPGSEREGHQRPMTSFLEEAGARIMAPGQTVNGLRKDGTKIPIECRLSAFTEGERLAIAAVRDVSERRTLEERLRATQRMESIGRLAGGIAHDFNNLLAVIVSYGQFIRESVPEGGELSADIDEVLGAADRATALTRQLLAFSRRQIIVVRRTDLNELVESLTRMLQPLLGEDIELQHQAGAGLWPVEVDPSQIEQVVLNLTVNARHAMPGGGKLALETSNVTLDEAYARQHPEVVAGDYVRLAVSDTGCGMTAEVRARIFEPFFTTKAVGQGTGLGLATVYGIVKQARGHIWVYSEPGAGSSFKVYLPRAQGTAEALVAGVAKKKPRGGLERILVVEDEPVLRKVIVRTLRGVGYTVLEATNGVDALLKCQTCGGALELLLTDVVMPQMGGRELADKAVALYPRIRVLYMSGYTENAIVHQGVLEPGMFFLQKPFVPDDLLRRVRQLMDGAGAPA